MLQPAGGRAGGIFPFLIYLKSKPPECESPRLSLEKRANMGLRSFVGFVYSIILSYAKLFLEKRSHMDHHFYSLI